MNIIKKIIIGLNVLLLCSSCDKSSKGQLVIELENSKELISNLKLCENKEGFEVFIDSVFQEKIKNKKIKKMYLKNGLKKIDISLYNIFYSPKESLKQQSPLTPKGNLAIFKAENGFSIDIRSTDKSEIYELLDVDKVDVCN